MQNELTNDAKYLLCTLYKHYKEQRSRQIDKSSAKYIGDCTRIQKDLIPEWLLEDVDETCRELSRAGFVESSYADDMATNVSLSDKAIIYMENRFKNGIKELIEFMLKLKGAF